MAPIAGRVTAVMAVACARCRAEQARRRPRNLRTCTCAFFSDRATSRNGSSPASLELRFSKNSRGSRVFAHTRDRTERSDRYNGTKRTHFKSFSFLSARPLRRRMPGPSGSRQSPPPSDREVDALASCADGSATKCATELGRSAARREGRGGRPSGASQGLFLFQLFF